jgi:hypothetical protein
VLPELTLKLRVPDDPRFKLPLIADEPLAETVPDRLAVPAVAVASVTPARFRFPPTVKLPGAVFVPVPLRIRLL